MNNHRSAWIKRITFLLLAVLIVYGMITAWNCHADPEDLENLGNTLGPASLVPAAVSIISAFIYQNVILSLGIGLFSAAFMYAALLNHPVNGFSTAVQAAIDIVSTHDKAAVLILCAVIGGFVEVLRCSGGFHAMAEKMTKHINTPVKASLGAELLGILVFFDDYANSLIVGPVMKPVTDRLHVSREKLAYIVDSTAAPVTGIAVISSWVAVETAVIQEGLQNAGLNLSSYTLFLAAVPFCFYCLFCLIFIFLESVTGREFGPMLAAETRARHGETLRKDSSLYEEEKKNAENESKGSAAAACIPLVILFAYALISFYVEGRSAAIANGLLRADAPFTLQNLSTAFGQADTVTLVLEASLIATTAALLIGVQQKCFTFQEGIQAFVHGASGLMNTLIILVLAWAMSALVGKLGTVYYASNVISNGTVWWLVPAFIFLSCCLISFAVGSFGCMSIAMPMAVPAAVSTMQSHPFLGYSFLALCTGCALSGCIFGDHCSPITDCTILSSQGAGCDNFDHVKTQLPYAFTCAAVSVLFGILPSTFGFPAWASCVLGTAAILVILQFIGKVPGNPCMQAHLIRLKPKRRPA